MKTTLILALLLVLASSPAAAQPAPQPDVWRAFAERLDVGSRIRVQTREGERVTATLVQAAPDALLVQPRTRTPVPVQRLSYEEIVSIERDDQRGIGAGKAVAIGVAAGVATFFGIMLIMLSALD